MNIGILRDLFNAKTTFTTWMTSLIIKEVDKWSLRKLDTYTEKSVTS